MFHISHVTNLVHRIYVGQPLKDIEKRSIIKANIAFGEK